MRATVVIAAGLLGLAWAGPALAMRPGLSRLPNAVAVATPGTGSAPVLSAGIAAGAALAAMTRRKSGRRARGMRFGSVRPL